MHCCIVKYFAFNCTRTALQSRAVFRPYLHGKYFAVQQQQQPAEWAGFVMAICICHGSFPIFCPPPLPFCASIAFVGIWRRFIDCVVFGRTIFVYIFPPARLPGCLDWIDSFRLTLCRSMCCFWNIFNKTLYAFHFCNNCAALSSGIWSICLECWRTISSMLPVPAACCQLPLPAASVYIFRMFTSGIKLNVY